MNENLKDMLNYGVPRLWYYDSCIQGKSGFICAVKLNTSKQYLAVSVDSEAFTDPRDAVQQCYERLLDLVNGKHTLYLEEKQ